jgi:hypothetical protein
MILAPILGTVRLTLVTVSHLIPIAMGYELVPAYIAADPAGQATRGTTADTFAAIALVTKRCRQFSRLGRGRSAVCGGDSYHACAAALARMVGLLVGALAGWLGLISPASWVMSAISSIGFIAFFVFMLRMGIALLRRRSKVEQATQASMPAPN